jgi:hypothetical protein
MSPHRCMKELYRSFLQASNMLYSGLALSEVSPISLSHDSISRWLADKNFRPREIWSLANNYIRSSEPCVLIADDTVLSKTRSQKIERVNYQYSGNVGGDSNQLILII